ncbi:serine/threonine-protein kinase [Mycobacterium vicinigordonae]|uniref:non-specific serine/threonine protein kinase n=1 Tax=Mycobacterium vicinigordonae TaxID=1719132 RepID=A0A7D6I9Y6_9MYCO|nr:serine/threonine protein kinase [Mycobacterium vicinigordonae]
MTDSSFGRYQLQGLLGRGGMGQVYRAYDTQTDRVVAIKLLPPHLVEDEEFQQRFRREARIAASLSDPHVVPIHSFGAIDGRLYVDMRLVDGRDLVKFIAEKGGRLTPAQTVAIIDQTAAALESAHRAGLVHRDVKPSNILVAHARDFVYLIDFGLARAQTDTSLTSTGQTMGTLAYLAPERFRGITDSRADVYSLGCVLYECLTGSRPFPGDTYEEQISAHFHAPPPRPAAVFHDVPPAFDAVVARALAKDPRTRFQTVTELGDAARAALGGAAVALPPPPPDTGPDYSPQPVKAGSRAALIATVAGSGLTLVLVAAAVAFFASGNDAPPDKPTPVTTTSVTSSEYPESSDSSEPMTESTVTTTVTSEPTEETP